jgi:hypothetical protein
MPSLNSTILLDQKNERVISQNGVCRVRRVLPDQAVEYSFNAPGFQEAKGSTTFTAGETRTIDVTLEPNH